MSAAITIENKTLGRSSRDALINDVRTGLARRPMELPPRWFYDARGSHLFEEITRLPEYYLTRSEEEILRARAREIVEATKPASLVDLGSGSSEKTLVLIEAAHRAGFLKHFVPFDVSETIVSRSAQEIVELFPGTAVHAVIGDFATDLGFIPRFDRQLVAFLGSTIGNLTDEQRAGFLRQIRGLMHSGDSFLLGVDLVKDRAEIVAAYNDPGGVTSEFNHNVLAVLNRELDADFGLDAFDHEAVWNEDLHRIEMYLRANRAQTVSIPGADLTVAFDDGDAINTEISVKFTRADVDAFLAEAGLETAEWYTDSHTRFALTIAMPTG